MSIEVEIGNKKYEIEGDELTGEEIIKKLGLYVDAVVILVDGSPVPCTEKISGKKVKIINVGSRG